MTDLLARVESELENARDETLKRRINAWKMRLLGHSFITIAEELDVSIGTAHADVRWCHENLPLAFDSTQDFRHIALERIESWFVALAEACARGDDSAIKTSNMLTDMQAKLLGGYAPTRVDATVRTQYEIIGVNTDGV